MQVQPPPLRRRKSHARNKKPRYLRGKKKPNSGKKHGVQPVELPEQEPLVPVTLKEFFPRGFFKNATVNMVSCSELEDKDDGEDAQEDLQKASSSNTNDRVLAILEASPERMSWKEIFQLPHEMREQVAAAMR